MNFQNLRRDAVTLKYYITKSVFTKLFLLYSIILIVTFATISITLSLRISTMLTKQAVEFNMQVLNTVENCFDQKCRSLKNAMKNLYDNPDFQVSKDVFSFLDLDKNIEVIKFVDIQNSVYKFLKDNAFDLDSDITDAAILSRSSNLIINSGKTSNSSYAGYVQTVITSNEKKTEQSGKVKFIPGFNPNEDTDKPNLLTIYDVIKDSSDHSKKLGYISFSFIPGVFKNSYSNFSNQLKGNIMIFDYQGGVLFDSGDSFYGKSYPYFSKIKKLKSGTLSINGMKINVITNDEFGFLTVGIIPKPEMDKYNSSMNTVIFGVSIISIIIILILTFMGSKLFAKRIKKIIKAIKSIRNGDLTVRLDSEGNDELQEIGSNINLMCDRLNEYIEKEYVFNLKQKEAELYALQSQINPHFLYNSLETIRMKALSMGDSDVSRMIFILSSLFKRTIKGEMVVSIAEEIEYCRFFLDLYSIRYEGRLEVEFDISPLILKFGIVKHLIQPVLENSLMHGLNLNNDNNIISIKGTMEENDIYITISDNGIGIDAERLEKLQDELKKPFEYSTNSIGISNVNYRIRLMYGEDYGLSLKSREFNGTEVTLKIKAKSREELISYVQGANRR